MTFEQMTTEQLRDVISQCNAELAKQADAAKKKAEEDVRKSPAFKKLAAAYQKIVARVDGLCGTEELSVTIPVKITLNTTSYMHDNTDDYCPKALYTENVFRRTVTGKVIGAVAGLNKKQQKLLQEGLDGTIDRACEAIVDFFPQAAKAHEACVKELNDKVLPQANELGLRYEDLE